MKSDPLRLLVPLALGLAGALLPAQEPAKPQPAPGRTQVEIGPLGLAISVSSPEGAGAKTAYLGVVAAPVPPQLRAQLDLPEGMGLSVEAVAQGSPAEKAGIRQYDVLKRFNDQMLCTQDQLSVLVKAAGKDSKVSLVVLRSGKEQTVTVTLGEHEAPETGRLQFSVNGAPGVSIEVRELDKLFKEGAPGRLLPEILGLTLDGIGKRDGGIHLNWEELRKKHEQRQRDVQAQIDAAVKKAQEAARQAAEAAGKAGAAGAAQAQVFSFYPGAQRQSVVTVVDADGTIEITDADGKRMVRIKDPSGREIHAGPLNNDADRAAVPEKFRAKVKDAEGRIKTGAEGENKKPAEKKPRPPKAVGNPI